MCYPGRPGPNGLSQKGSPSPALPEREVSRRLLLVLVGVDARTVAQLPALDSGQAAIAGERGDPIVDRALTLVGVTLVAQPFDHADHLGDVIGGPRIELNSLDPKKIEALEERALVPLRVLLEAHPLRQALADRLVVDVGDVHHLRDL